LRDSIPECRTDDFIEEMLRKLDWICGRSGKLKCPLLIAGDLFHHWKPSPWLLAAAIVRFKKAYEVFVVAGQHDLPQHQYELIEKSGLQVLENAGVIQVVPAGQFVMDKDGEFLLHGFPFGSEMKSSAHGNSTYPHVALCHVMTYKKKRPYPGCEEDNSKKLMKKLNHFDLIVTGDNHETFVDIREEQLLVNAGSMMRTTAIQEEHEPSIFFWYADEGEVEQIKIPIKKDVVSRDHLDVQSDRKDRIDAFVKRMKE
ncbi:unnamed protein product, partial [marine sediment metagenome]